MAGVGERTAGGRGTSRPADRTGGAERNGNGVGHGPGTLAGPGGDGGAHDHAWPDHTLDGRPGLHADADGAFHTARGHGP